MDMRFAFVNMALLLLPAFALPEPTTLTVRVTGLFQSDREKDLRELFAEQLPEVTIAKLDFDRAEAELAFDAAKAFPKVKPADILKQIDQKIRTASTNTFSILPASTVPRDKLVRVEIAVAGLDCKACCLGAYEIVAKVEGVEQATASFKEGRISALIDPTKTDKEKLEEELRKRRVSIR
jgi:hypothetical protein